MSQFKVHVQHITYGWCGIEISINGKRIICEAGYLGSNPIASLISACLELSVTEIEVGENEEYISKSRIVWEEEPGTMSLDLKLSRSNQVSIDIQERDDDENILEEWHEGVPFDDFKQAIVSEGFRVLNTFGLYGYYVAWLDRQEFPLSQLLRLTDKLKLTWNGDNCSTDLAKEMECLSAFAEQLEI